MFEGVTPTGRGLTVIISCEYVPHHDWMVFAAWYSITKNLPDADVKIACLRGISEAPIYLWARKSQVSYMQYSEKTKNLNELFGVKDALIITPDVMAVTKFLPESVGPISAKSDVNVTFASYSEGCGKFVNYEWIDTLRNPFTFTSRLISDDLLLNEYRILKIWERCSNPYNALAGAI